MYWMEWNVWGLLLQGRRYLRQAEELRGLGQVSPFGNGVNSTVVDVNVRNSIQIDASKVQVGGTMWSQTLSHATKQCCEDLGIDPNVNQHVKHNLYKLLLYEKGGFFKPHQDSEKERGMFGTMVVQLPSYFEGGALVVHHEREQMTFDWSGEKAEKSCYVTAFYGDCIHEVLPVTAGWRICLVYNLVLDHSYKENFSADTAFGNIRELELLGRAWETSCSLKGGDKQLAQFLVSAKDRDGKKMFEVFLVLLEKHDRGTPDYDNPNRMIPDYVESEVRVHETLCFDDKNFDHDPFDENYLGFDLDTHLLQDVDDVFSGDPDHSEFEGFQGNWGPTLEFWFYHGALVFKPAK